VSGVGTSVTVIDPALTFGPAAWTEILLRPTVGSPSTSAMSPGPCCATAMIGVFDRARDRRERAATECTEPRLSSERSESHRTPRGLASHKAVAESGDRTIMGFT